METEGKQNGNHRHFLGLVKRVKAVLQRDLAQTDKVCVPMLLSVAELVLCSVVHGASMTKQ